MNGQEIESTTNRMLPSWNMEYLNKSNSPYGWKNDRPLPYQSTTYTRLYLAEPGVLQFKIFQHFELIIVL